MIDNSSLKESDVSFRAENVSKRKIRLEKYSRPGCLSYLIKRTTESEMHLFQCPTAVCVACSPDVGLCHVTQRTCVAKKL